ncbi:MAG: hypothetical protein EKK62_16840 [Acidimicrobiia bacterium]|nr:MAG: hypothetical protein EKK62_16840 [Acidimicrobiia bacterium]
MTWAVYLNETNLSTIGAYTMRLASYTAAPARTYPTLALPGRQGAVLTADPEMGPRTLQLSITISTTANTIAARATAEDRLKALAYNALVKLVVDDDVNAPRQIDAVCTACEVTTRAHPVDAVVSDVSLTLLCPDPTWYDVTGQVIGFSSTASAVPLGTAPSGGIVRVVAPSWSANVVDPVVTYLNAAGVTLKTMTFSGTLTAGTEYLEIDLDRQTVVEVSSGTSANAISWLSTASEFFVLDPMDGDVLNSSYPQLKVTATSGTPTATWAGARRWL